MIRKESMQFLNTSWKHVRRYPYQAFAAVFIMIQTFLVISFFTFLVVGATSIINYFESVPKVTAFFKDTATPENIDALKDQVQATGKIATIHFVSKQEALKIYSKQVNGEAMLMELVTADILPSSLEVSTKDVKDLGTIASIMKSSSSVDKVIFQKDIVETLRVWTDAIRKIGIVLISVLALDSIFIMVIIIGIKISQKKKEIEVSRLLGATNWYVRWPFIFEGMFYGVVGAVVGWVIAVGGLLYATPFLNSTLLKTIPLLPASPIFLLELLGVELFFAIVLGVFASYIAVLRYLK
jgi:cell division transport system permease protein